MYSDEKPRIRKGKERKTEEEHGIIHHKIPDPKVGTKSINLDIQNKHDGGGHRNAKIFLLSLVVILTGLVGLIIMENRVDTLFQGSCFIEYFKERIYYFRKEHDGNRKTLLKLDILPVPLKSLEENVVENDAVVLYLSQQNSHPASQINKVVHSEENTSIPKIDSSSVVVQSLNTSDKVTESNQVKEPQPNNFISSLQRYKFLYLKYPNSPEAIYGKILYLSFKADITGSTDIIKSVLTICLQYLEFDELISDNDFKVVSFYCISRSKLINLPYPAIRIYLKLIERFEDDPQHRNVLAGTFLDMGRFADATFILEENLKRFPNNGTSSTLYGHICYIYYKLEKAAHYLRLGIESNQIAIFSQRARDYSILGETLILLNRTHEAREILRRGVVKRLFPSVYQRPGQYTIGLKAQPIWTKEETTYSHVFNVLESNWQRIRDEGLSALNDKIYFRNVNDGITDGGLWQVLYIFLEGKKILRNCKKVPFTCALVESLPAECVCFNYHISFTVIHPGTHLKPHCGPHNNRIRVHLGLKIPNGSKIRIAENERSWEEGKFLIFDDSFEHEVWNNGSSIRLILNVDIWHPQVTDEQKTVLKS